MEYTVVKFHSGSVFMSSNTKILVLKARELIYTLIFAVLGVALILLMIYMFSEKGADNSTTEASTTEASEDSSETTDEADGTESEPASAIITTTTYVPGSYEAAINLGGTLLNLEVYVDDTCVPVASINNLSDDIKEMYPLIEPALEEINSQLADGCTPDEITYSYDNKYTSLMIIDAIRSALLD
jgi:hypothetical protein